MSGPNPDRAAGTVDHGVSAMPPAAAPSPDPTAGVVENGVSVVPPAGAPNPDSTDGTAGMVDYRVSGVPPAAAPTEHGVPGVPPAGAPNPDATARSEAAAAEPDRAAGMVDHRLTAIPPAARRLQGRRAGLITRLLANTVDFCVAAAVVAGGYAGVAALRFLWNSRSFAFPEPGFGVAVIAGSVVMTIYLTACWTASGRTYGDHLLGLRVLGRRGRPLRPVAALLRAALCVLFPIGLFWIVISRDNRSVQDVLLRSSVVYDWARTPLSGRTGRGGGAAGTARPGSP